MTHKKHRSAADPSLQRQLESSATEHDSVEAVCRLRTPDTSADIPTPSETEALVRAVLDRVEKLVGVGPLRVNVFRNLGSLAVTAERAFLKALAEQPEIAAATANRRSEKGGASPNRNS